MCRAHTERIFAPPDTQKASVAPYTLRHVAAVDIRRHRLLCVCVCVLAGQIETTRQRRGTNEHILAIIFAANTYIGDTEECAQPIIDTERSHTQMRALALQRVAVVAVVVVAGAGASALHDSGTHIRHARVRFT